MNISINEPCHENWDAMTPNQQGAFCKSCMKDVVDFSAKSLEEIKTFFSKPQTGKVCGRFEEKQLQELSFDDFFSRFTYWNFTKKFAAIFFMAFGFWIFSNSGIMAQNGQHLKGEVMIAPDRASKKDTVKKQVTDEEQRRHIKGKIAMNTSCSNPKITEEKHMIKGDTIVSEPIKTEPVKKEEYMVMGMIAMVPKKQKEPEVQHQPEKTVVEDTTKKQPIPEAATEKSKTVSLIEEPINDRPGPAIYPNPNSGSFVIEANTKQTIYMFDENGRLVLTQSISGTTAIDAGNLNAGIYNLHITGDEGLIKKRIVIIK
ncbi:MAG TPA: T9SS type A sorting domain-containing protein [Bacteroidia bacterium]|jgi:hypothetical protein|nr:T9SS type A sorting domain-containing protein [Bacteroidia bacterium]